jgi:hypothetical protein
VKVRHSEVNELVEVKTFEARSVEVPKHQRGMVVDVTRDDVDTCDVCHMSVS